MLERCSHCRGMKLLTCGLKTCRQCREHRLVAQQRARDAGLCPVCGKRQPPAGRVLCVQCLDRPSRRVDSMRGLHRRVREFIKDMQQIDDDATTPVRTRKD